MSDTPFTESDLRRVLLEGAGVPEGSGLDGDILDVPFDEIGYDSLALLETGTRVEREWNVRLDEAMAGEARTPREFIALVNHALGVAA